jgi:MFS family permease
LLACCIFLVGGVIQTAGVVIAMLYIGRLIAGIGVGVLTMIIPIYQAELAHRKIRGKITSLQQLFNALGQIFATWIGYGCYLTWSHTGNSREWRVPLGCQLVPAIFLGGLIMTFPESPRFDTSLAQQCFEVLTLNRWLCAHDQADEGLRVLALLHAHNDLSDSYVLAEFELIQSQISAEKSQKSIGYLDLFRGWPNLRRTILVMAIQASCQMTGVSAIQYFSPQIFAQIGIPTSRSLLFQAVNAIIAFAGTTVCILTIDGVGRRPLQICGHLFLCATFVINAVIIKVFPTTSNNTSAHWAFVVITWLFNFGQSKSFRYKFRLLTIVYSVLPHEWTSKLGCTSRIVRNSNALERRLLGCNDLFRFQHDDWTSNSNRHILNRLGEFLSRSGMLIPHD